ncbi:MAG: diaminopimelate decarboxylase [Alphaproteobacteria bacterium]|nr:diaminopimelate decarboxylase [Alphaproteobacteria bacterium]
MDHFVYRGGALHAEDVALATIAEHVGTPFYCYAAATLRRHYRVFRDALAGVDSQVFYALKANSNLAVVALLAAEGAGADVVSEGEIRRALAAGVPPERIVFSGVGKSESEIAFALDSRIHQFNVESEPELIVLSRLAAARQVTADIAIRINPDVDAATHAKITTGKRENKFGIAWPYAREVYRRAAALPAIAVRGIAVHIGSQLTDLGPFEAAFRIVADAVRMLRQDGHRIDRLDFGGGLGVPYGEEAPPSPAAYGAAVKRIAGQLGCRLMFEPGRLLVANAGILVTRVIYVKKSDDRTFVIVDAAMNDLIRPTLYEAKHTVVTVRERPAGAESSRVDVVGPVCETGDYLALDHPLPTVHAGELLAIRTAGAYGAVMASSYNSRPIVPEVLVSAGRYSVVRSRPSYRDMLSGESIPDWARSEASR